MATPLLYSAVRRHVNIAGFALATLVCLRAAGLAAPTTHASQDKVMRDPWYREAPAQLKPWDWPRVDPTKVFQVAGLRLADAQRRLLTRPLVALTATEAAHLTGQSNGATIGGKYYLVRALYYEGGSGEYFVRLEKERLRVFHLSLGSWPVPMKRSALVVVLSARPTQLYVGCGRYQ